MQNGAICLLEDTSAGIKKSSICSNFQDCKRVCAVLDTTNGRTNIIALGTKGEIAWVQGPSFAESTLLGQSYLPNPSFLLYWYVTAFCATEG